MKHQKIATAILFCYLLQLFTIKIGLSYVFTGYEIQDVNNDATFVQDAAQWTTSERRTTDIWSQCDGTYLVGGYGVLGTSTHQSGDYYQRIYTGLPEHTMIHYTITFWAIDSWDLGGADGGDTFYLMFDSTKVNGWVMDLSWFTQQLCGSMNAGWNEAPNIRIFGTVTHYASSLTFQVVSHLDEESQNESFGFRDIVFVFDQSGTTGNTMCGSATSVALPNNVCTCSEGQYYTGSACASCNSLCKSCYGGSASQCYECATTGGVFWDGDECTTCYTGCGVCTGPNPTDCLQCTSGYAYFAWINQCVVDCEYPLVKSTDSSGNYICTSPCANDQFIYWDQSCSNTCASLLQQRTLYGVVKLCRYPCSPVEYLYWDGTCQQDCWLPLTVTVEQGVQYCGYSCSDLQYLYWDSTCGSTCDAPFKTRTQNGKQFCHPPCEITYYLYPDGTCLDTCTGSWTSTTTSQGVQYCNFNCADSEFYYWDGRCLTTCNFPLQTRYQYGQAYCDYPTDVNNYLYWDGTSSAVCDSPLSPRTEGTPVRKYCDYGCSIWDYMYWNGDCDEECDFPLQPRIQNGRKFCDFGCTDSTNYLYWNGTCGTGCDSPFVSNPSRSRNFCDSPPTTASSGGLGTTAPSLFYYWDGSSETDCVSPLTQRIEGTMQYCDYKCTNALEYLYWNGSCIVGCDPPLTQDTQKGKQFCNYKCDANEFLHTNGSCLSLCDSPYVAETYGSNNFCFDACSDSSGFYYWNNTCLPTCSAPLQQITLGSLIWCVYPCLANQFLLNDGSCIETCDLPLSMTIEAGYKYCTNPCAAGEYLFYNGSCIPSCDAPLREKDGNLCILPCDSEVEYYNEPTGACITECDTPSENQDDLYLICLAPEVIINYGTLLDVLLKAPETGAITLVTVPSGLQYVRYLGIQMPTRLANFTESQGRSILSLRFGQQMSSDMQSVFVTRTLLVSAADRYQPPSSFIVNFWEELTSLTIMITAAMFITILEQICKTREWTSLQAFFEKLRIITRWNFCLVLIATSVGEIVYFASLEFKSWSTSSSPSALSIELCLIMIGVIIALLVTVIYLVHRLQLVKRKSIIYKTREEFDKFQTDWQGYQIIFRGFRSTTVLNQLFFLVYVVRMGLPMIVAAYLTVSPIAQTVLYILISLAILLYVLHQKPLLRRVNYIQLLIMETVTLVMNCSLFGLTVLVSNNSTNSHLIASLGDLVVGSTSFINLVALVFLAIKLIDGVRTIYKYQKTSKIQDKTVYLQLLVFFVQQGGMGFEEIFVSEEAARIFNQPDKLLPDKKIQQAPDMKILLKQKPQFLASDVDVVQEEPPQSFGIFKLFSKFKPGKKQTTERQAQNSNESKDSKDSKDSKENNTSTSLLRQHIKKLSNFRPKSRNDNSLPSISNADISSAQPVEDTSLMKLHKRLTIPFDESSPKSNVKSGNRNGEENAESPDSFGESTPTNNFIAARKEKEEDKFEQKLNDEVEEQEKGVEKAEGSGSEKPEGDQEADGHASER